MKTDDNLTAGRAFAYVRVSTTKKESYFDEKREEAKQLRQLIDKHDLSVAQIMGDWIVEYKKTQSAETKKVIERQSLLKQAKDEEEIEFDISINEHGDEFVQTFDSQLVKIHEQAARDGFIIPEENIIKDRISGAKFDRPGLNELKARVKEGDMIYVYSLDRIGRSTLGILTLIEDLCERGVTVDIITNRLKAGKNTTKEDRLLFEIVSSFASFERAIIRQRVRSGIEAAKAKPNPPQFGRGDRITQKVKNVICGLAESGIPAKEIISRTGVSRPVVYKIIKKNGLSEQYKIAQLSRKGKEELTLDGGSITQEEKEKLFS